jgi:hypothetical protein
LGASFSEEAYQIKMLAELAQTDQSQEYRQGVAEASKEIETKIWREAFKRGFTEQNQQMQDEMNRKALQVKKLRDETRKPNRQSAAESRAELEGYNKAIEQINENNNISQNHRPC